VVAGRQRLSRPAGGGSEPPPGPIRTCIGCRRRACPAELVRIVRLADGSLAVGRTLPGRGAWLCRGRPDCLGRAEQRRAFARALRAPLRPGAIDDLRARLAATGPDGSPPTGLASA
jgi:predicted RNA-binding protein YlxR (DUF448 family)